MIRRAIRFLIREWKIRRDPIAYTRSIGVQVGENCRLIGVDAGTFSSEPYLIRLGNRVTITAGVRFITHDDGVWLFLDEFPDLDIIAPIRVGNNVYIGINAIIMPGVTIGDNCIIGAGSIVTRDIPSGSVAVGSPARVIKTVDQYKEKALKDALRIRTLTPTKKREALIKKFIE